MSPYYGKEGDNWKQWLGQPHDMTDDKGRYLGVGIDMVEDPEKIRVSVTENAKSYVIGERGTVIFPGQSAILNRDGFEVVDAGTRKTRAQVIHSEKPIGKREQRVISEETFKHTP